MFILLGSFNCTIDLCFALNCCLLRHYDVVFSTKSLNTQHGISLLVYMLVNVKDLQCDITGKIMTVFVRFLYTSL